MTLIRQYGPATLDRASVNTSLTLDPHDEIHSGGVKRWEQRNPHGKGIQFYLTGLHSFGVGAFAHENPIEAQARRRYQAINGNMLTNLTYVEIHGRGEGRGDSILIQNWNEFGVLSETLVAFEVKPS
jgi:hypothetical protein